jgi:hypothetical protein
LLLSVLTGEAKQVEKWHEIRTSRKKAGLLSKIARKSEFLIDFSDFNQKTLDADVKAEAFKQLKTEQLRVCYNLFYFALIWSVGMWCKNPVDFGEFVKNMLVLSNEEFSGGP